MRIFLFVLEMRYGFEMCCGLEMRDALWSRDVLWPHVQSSDQFLTFGIIDTRQVAQTKQEYCRMASYMTCFGSGQCHTMSHWCHIDVLRHHT